MKIFQTKKTLLIIFFYLLTINSVYAQELPELGNRGSSILSPHDEQELGKIFLQEIQREVPIIHDPMINEYINALGKKLVINSTNPKNHFDFFVVENSSINAFTGPNGYIGVNTGLISTTKTESELASVLAHEISHVNQHHLAYTLERAKSSNISTLAILVAAAVIGAHSNSDIAAAAIPAAIDQKMQGMLGFSRENEAEADRIGMQNLYKAGFDPAAMPDFFERMQRATLDYGEQIPAYFQNHPLTSDRIADVENRSKQYPPKKIASSYNYYLIKARINVLTAPTGYSAVNYFKSQIQNNTYDDANAANYGYALALIRENKTAEAESIITSLINKNPDEPAYSMILAHAKVNAKQYQEALKILSSSSAKHPNYYPITIQYAQTLLSANQPEEARLLLQKQVNNHANDEVLFSLLAQAQGQSGHLAEAYQTRAKLFEIYGNNKLAVVQLEQALQIPNLDAITKTNIQAKINIIKGIPFAPKRSK